MVRKIKWSIFGFLAISVGLYPLLYFFIDRTFGLLSSKSSELLADLFWNIAFYGHIVPGGIALSIGWLQFSSKLRKKNIQLHRNLGKLYMVTVLISGLCALYIGLHATGGPIAKIGFISLGTIWLYTTLKAYVAIRNKNIISHQKFMTLSYAVCFSAVTLRIWLPLIGMNLEFIPAYRIVAWLCWVPNLIVGMAINKFSLST